MGIFDTASLSNSMLLLSQTQAKSALALKNIVKLSPTELRQILPSNSSNGSDSSTSSHHRSSHSMTQKDRLRAAVRGALGSRHPHEADLSDSQFLGHAASDSKEDTTDTHHDDGEGEKNNQEQGTLLSDGQESTHNPVDEM